jgi:hypothetical protein
MQVVRPDLRGCGQLSQVTQAYVSAQLKCQRGDQIRLTSIELQVIAYRKLVTDVLVLGKKAINSDRDARDAMSARQIALTNRIKPRLYPSLFVPN